jgi:hypothetical protein
LDSYFLIGVLEMDLYFFQLVIHGILQQDLICGKFVVVFLPISIKINLLMSKTEKKYRIPLLECKTYYYDS